MRAILTHLETSKKLTFGLAALVAAALLVTMVGYTALTRTVTLTVDGKSHSIRTFGDDVESVLASEGIDVTSRDAVLPSLDSPVSDGSQISVRFGRKLVVDVDGKQSTHWTTANRVETAIREIGLRASRGSHFSASRGSTIDRSGMTLQITSPKTLTLVVGLQEPRTVTLPVRTGRDALKAVGVPVDGDDIVKVETDKPGKRPLLVDGDTVTYVKVGKRPLHRDREVVPFTIVEKADSSMYVGETVVEREGVAGLRNVDYTVVYHNGREVKKIVRKQQVLEKATAQIVRVGTKESPYGVFDRLAQCESGGNWAANTGNGYYGGVQFSLSTWRAVGGSGYPHQHSREEQIKRATILQERAGWGQWPHCSAQLGLR